MPITYATVRALLTRATNSAPLQCVPFSLLLFIIYTKENHKVRAVRISFCQTSSPSPTSSMHVSAQNFLVIVHGRQEGRGEGAER